MEELNKRESQMFEYIKAYMLMNGTTPTLREIGAGVGFKSTNTTHYYFSKLVMKGYIDQRNGNHYSVKGMEYQEVVK